MIKNQSNIYQFILRDMIGQGITGLTPTVQIRKDSGSFAATTNTPTEVGYGAYEVILTATECNCDVMMFMVTLPDGQFPAILENERLITTGGATPAEIWGYTGGRTVDNTIPTVNEIWGRQAGDTTSRTLTNLNIQSELTTYGAAKTSDVPSVSSIQSGLSRFNPSTDTVTINSTQVETIAKAADLGSVAAKVELIKAKTDNLPASPAATSDIPSDYAKPGDAMTLTTAYDAAKTASQFDVSTDTVNLSIDSVRAVQYGLATDENVGIAVSTIITAMPAVPSAGANAAAVWTAEHRSLTDSPDIQSELTNYGAAKTSDVPTVGEIADGVWTRTPRTVTGGGGGGGSGTLYCTQSELYAHWTQAKIEAWSNGSVTAVDNAIAFATQKINDDLASTGAAPFNPVPADIRNLCVLAAGIRLASLSGDTTDPSVQAAIAYYNEFVEDFVYRVNANN